MGNRLWRRGNDYSQAEIEEEEERPTPELRRIENENEIDIEEQPVNNYTSVDGRDNSGQSNGVYFGSHFLLAPRNSHDDGDLSELRPDISTLIQGGFSVSRAQHPPIQHTVAVTSNVNLHKESISIVKGTPTTEPTPTNNILQLQFKVDVLCDSTIKVYYGVIEKDESGLSFQNITKNAQNVVTTTLATPIAEIQIPKGLNQLIILPVDQGLNTSLFTVEELEYNSISGKIPIVISVEATVSTLTEISTATTTPSMDDTKAINSQFTYAKLVQISDGTYALKVMKVKIKFRGKYYAVYDIYGVSNTETPGNDTESIGRECVICMTEPRDTTVFTLQAHVFMWRLC